MKIPWSACALTLCTRIILTLGMDPTPTDESIWILMCIKHVTLRTRIILTLDMDPTPTDLSIWILMCINPLYVDNFCVGHVPHPTVENPWILMCINYLSTENFCIRHGPHPHWQNFLIRMRIIFLSADNLCVGHGHPPPHWQRGNSKIYMCMSLTLCTRITFANSLYPDLDSNCLILWWNSWIILRKSRFWKKSANNKKHAKYRVCKNAWTMSMTCTRWKSYDTCMSRHVRIYVACRNWTQTIWHFDWYSCKTFSKKSHWRR